MNIIEKDGQKYVKIGDKAVPFNEYDENGKPVITPTKVVNTKHPDGRKDVRVEVPVLEIRSTKQQ